MSVGVGLICDDGIVMAADSLFEGNSRTYDRKLWGVNQPFNAKLTWALAAAGLDQHVRGLFGEIHERTGKLRSFNGLHERIDELTRDFFEKDVWTTPGITRDEWPEFLIAIGESDRQRLYTVSTSGGLTPVMKGFSAIGSGGPLADYIAQTFFDPKAGIVAAQYLAAYIVSQAKRHSPGCGGDTQIAVVPKKRRPFYMRAEDITRLETYFEQFFERASRLAYAGLYPSPHDRIDSLIDEMKIAVRELRKSAHKGEPLGEQLQAVFGPPKEVTPVPQASTRDRKDRPPSQG